MTIFIFVFGLCIGSFLNVVIYRLPHGFSIAKPASHCPNCGYFLKKFDLIPIVSWLLLRAKCRNCHCNISSRYPLVELVCGLLFVICYYYTWNFEQFVFAALFAAALLAITMIDFDLQIIPDEILIFLGLLSLCANGYAQFFASLAIKNAYHLGIALVPFVGWWQMALGAGAGFALMSAIFLLSRGGMGGGDVKFAAVLGMWLGWKMVLLSLLFAFIIGGITGIMLMILKIKKRKDPVPFGPFMAISALVFVLFGPQLCNWYWSLV
ncbi:MAG: prepilin peptidase [Negativicutes bacterium]|jgi:leader peptidase (prepilin peptidase)/N-methyltransferase